MSFESFDVALWSLADVSLKATAVLLAAGLLSLALRGASSSVRHTLWLAAVAGVLALPVLAPALPAWRLPVAPAPAAESSSATADASDLALPPPDAPSPARAEPAAPPIPWGMLALAVWLVGVATVLVRTAAAGARIRALVATARPAGGAAWADASTRAAIRLGLGRGRVRKPLRLLVSSDVAAPATWGARSPVVLLPEGADEWPAARREAVLLHEFAHVRRWDCATQLAARLACAVYWFNPLVWVAAAALRAEREHAADDCVLDAGVRASDYASLLLEVACAAPRLLPHPAASFAGARRSHLERRVRCVLDPDRPRRPAGRAAALVAVGVVTLTVAPLAAGPAGATWPAAGDEVVEVVGESAKPVSASPALPARPVPATVPGAPRRAASQSRETPSAREPKVENLPSRSPSVDRAAVVAALEEALGDEDEGVRKQAAWALNMIRLKDGGVRHPRPNPRPHTVARPRVESEGERTAEDETDREDPEDR